MSRRIVRVWACQFLCDQCGWEEDRPLRDGPPVGWVASWKPSAAGHGMKRFDRCAACVDLRLTVVPA